MGIMVGVQFFIFLLKYENVKWLDKSDFVATAGCLII